MHQQQFFCIFWGKFNGGSKAKDIFYALHFPLSLKDLMMLQKLKMKFFTTWDSMVST